MQCPKCKREMRFVEVHVRARFRWQFQEEHDKETGDKWLAADSCVADTQSESFFCATCYECGEDITNTSLGKRAKEAWEVAELHEQYVDLM